MIEPPPEPSSRLPVLKVVEAVEDGVTGHLVAPGDVEALAAQWNRLFADNVRARQMGVAGRKAAANRWSLAAMVAGYEDLIDGIYTRKVAVSQISGGSYADRIIATKMLRGSN